TEPGRRAPLPERRRARCRARLGQGFHGCAVPVTLRAGFVGLGAMGLGMARNLHKHGLLSAVWNRTAEKATALAQETGCKAVSKLADLAPLCDVIVTCVSADTDVLAVIDELLPVIEHGTII